MRHIVHVPSLCYLMKNIVWQQEGTPFKMNVFMLSWVVSVCANWHFDKHVVKMILEMAQLLSSAHHVLDPNPSKRLYRKTHVNHPCAIWCRAHCNNYLWIAKLGLALCQEYTARYKKVHKTQDLLVFLHDHVPRNIATFTVDKTTENPCGFTLPIPQAMPTTYQQNSMVCTCTVCHTSVRVIEFPTSRNTYLCSTCKSINTLNISDKNASDCQKAYRAYYSGSEKRPLAKWKHGQPPDFMNFFRA